MHFCPGRVNEFGKSTCSAGSRYSGGVSVFRVNVIAIDPRKERRMSPAVEALVDTGSELTWLPADTLRLVGISPRRKRQFVTATGERVERDVGYAKPLDRAHPEQNAVGRLAKHHFVDCFVPLGAEHGVAVDKWTTSGTGSWRARPSSTTAGDGEPSTALSCRAGTRLTWL